VTIKIPKKFRHDRTVQLMLMVWKNSHLRYQEMSKRVNWANPKAGKIEKKRRRQKWRAVAQILDIQGTLLRMLAEETQHPDLWTDPDDPDTPESRRKMLLRQYDMNHRAAYNSRPKHGGSKKQRAELKKRRAILVRKIRDLERDWMVALFQKVYPHKTVPRPITLHPTELRPQKVREANQELMKEMQ
jgi:hypothetical protein